MGCSFSYCWILRVLCIFWLIVLYQMCLLQISSKSMAYLFILLTVSFAEHKFLILIKSSLSILSFIDCAFGVVSKRSLLDFPGGAVVKNCLPMQGTRVRSLVWEDPTCCGATKPMSHNYWAHAPQLLKLTHPRAHALQLLKPSHLEPVLRNKRSHCNEKAAHHNEE